MSEFKLLFAAPRCRATGESENTLIFNDCSISVNNDIERDDDSDNIFRSRRFIIRVIFATSQI